MELLTMEGKRANWNDDRLDELSRRVDEGFKEMREGFARVDEKFDRVEKKFDRIDEKFDRIGERIDTLIFTMWAAGGAVAATAVVSLVKLAFF
jgi:ribosome assembly protein YihI (activator of Der GTPase)